jgi:DNA-binding transcriptional ArsR family regulator
MPPGQQSLDPLLLDPTRLTIMSLLGSAQWCEYGFVRDTAQLTSPALSKQVATLTEAGLIDVHKGYVGKTPRTWLRATSEGRKRIAEHIRGLQAIADEAAAQGRGHQPEALPGGANTPDGH